MTNSSKSDSPTGKHSLDQFFYQNQQATLTNCDREPIHFIGSVQQEGAIIVLNPTNQQVVAWSDNLASHLQVVMPDEAEFPLTKILPELATELAEKCTVTEPGNHYPLMSVHETSKTVYHGVYHQHGDLGYLEFLPDHELTAQRYRDKLRALRSYCTQIIKAESFERAMELAAIAGREISEFARVKIYQFQPDWAGKVVAEAKAEHMDSYLGLYFPDTDIPKQARFLMKLVPYRCVANVEDNISPLVSSRNSGPSVNSTLPPSHDLSCSLLRASSTIHTTYLRNMGVASSFSASLMFRDELWGLIACHHDQSRLLPFDLWGAMQDLATTLMAKLEQETAKDKSAMIYQLRAVEESVAATIKDKRNIEIAMVEILPKLRQFLRADGFAFQFGATLQTEGQVPPDSFIHELLDWANTRTSGTETFISHSLQKEWPSAAIYQDTACGVLIEPVSLYRVCHLIWFRGPVTKTTTWAGLPEDKKRRLEVDGTETLLPRHSFSAWEEQHRDQCEPWNEAEISSAREILKNMLDILASQLQLSQSNEKLETFSYAAAHDLKTPLRHIRFVLDTIRDLKTPEDVAAMNDLINMALKSSVRLQQLIDGMLSYVNLEDGDVLRTPVAIREIIEDVMRLLRQEIDDTGVTFDIGSMPTLNADKELMTNLFLNLIGNSIKYRSKDRKAHIRIASAESPGFIEISLADNGQGIPDKFADKVFEPLYRLHSNDDIPGNGLGLAICQRIVEVHAGKIRLDKDYDDGARLILQFKR